MFDALTERLTGVFDRLSGRGVLSERDIDEALREVRIALLEADVALPVVREFIAKVREEAAGEAVIREGWEEAGLVPAQMAGLEAGGVIELDADIPEGRQRERLFVFDLALPAGFAPRAVDGEVAEHRLMPVDEAIARAAGGELTTDAALVTLDFALRRGLIEPEAAEAASTVIARASPAQLRAFEALRRPSPDAA